MNALISLGVALALTGCGALIDVDDLTFDRPEGMIAYADPPLFIDPTEITTSEYAAWLATSPAPASDASCAWNTSYLPGDASPDGAEIGNCGDYDWVAAVRDGARRPVQCIDWCDAAAYCAGQGKQMCGGARGAVLSLRYDAANNAFLNDRPGDSAWQLACTGAAGLAYPYGDAYAAGACNGNTGGLEDVAARASCEGGYPGMFDLSGNLEEWEDMCADSAPVTACARRGGAYYTAQVGDPSGLGCDSILVASRKAMSRTTGARCCWEP